MDSTHTNFTTIITSEDRTTFSMLPLNNRTATFPSRKEAQRKKKAHRAQPTSGCLSELSIPLPRDHDYFDAVKAFTETYSDYHAYLAQLPLRSPIENVAGIGIDDYAPHDSFAQESEAHGEAVSDDEIEGCGYLGWLRH
jgi:hypothetical protein